MARREPVFDSQDEIALRAANEFIADDARRGSVNSQATMGGGQRQRSRTRTGVSTSPARVQLVSYAATILFSTISARRLARLARHSRLTALHFPLAHYGTLGAVVLLVKYVVLRQSSGASADERSGRGGLILGEGGRGKFAWAAGAASAASMALRRWELLVGDVRLCEALEVFILPALLSMLPLAQSRLYNAGAQPSNAFLTASAASAFLVGFALIGVPANGLALLLALLRISLEAVALLLLKDGLASEGQAGPFLTNSVISAILVSLFALPISLFATPHKAARALDSSAFVSISGTLVFSVLSQISMLYALMSFASATAATSTFFPRNLALLIWSTFGRDAIALREHWLQVVLVYAAGSVALAWTDAEFSAAIEDARTEGEGGTYLPLNGSGPPTSYSSPSSPSFSVSSPTLHYRKSSDLNLPPQPTSSRPPLLSLVPFLSLLAYLTTTPATTSSLTSACSVLPYSLRSTVCLSFPSPPTSRTIDLVVSYYNESLPNAKKHIDGIRATEFVSERSSRVVIYNKGPRTEQEIRETMELQGEDEVVPLPNLGREGATYLKHILLHYNATLTALSPSYRPESSPSLAGTVSHLRTTTLADHTYFLQPHLAWAHVARPRLQLVGPDTGFAHFGPLLKSRCGHDERVDADFPVVKEMYNILTGEVCPPSGQLAAWSAQFAVSKRRILANPYSRYAYINELLEAPRGHWIHDMWGPNESGGPSNPAVGHSVERAWPVIFGCSDPTLADLCPDEVAEKEKCQCLDR
ncbi:hypothetical protein JCM11641_003165 [Rhodosporidiobolus odoratus]